MKKEYVKPETDVMEITVESMIATSGTLVDPTNPVIPSSNDRDEGRSWGNLWD